MTNLNLPVIGDLVTTMTLMTQVGNMALSGGYYSETWLLPVWQPTTMETREMELWPHAY